MFYREEKKSGIAKKQKVVKNLEALESFESLIKDKKRHDTLQQIQKNLGYQTIHYKKLGLPLVANVASYYQQLPGTSLYFSQPGGALDRILYRTEAALALLRQLMIFDESGLPTEEQKLWSYALFSASLLQGIGKLYTEYQINIHDNQGNLVKRWEPLLEHMSEVGNYYHYQFVREDSDSETLRRHVTVLLAQQLLPKEGFAQLSAHPFIFKAWLALLEEDRDGAGSLAAVLDRADAFALQRYLSDYLAENSYMIEQGPGNIGSFLDTAPENTVERERVIGAEFLIWVRDALSTGKIILNQPPFRAEIYPSGITLSAETYDMFLQEHLKLKSKFLIQRSVSAWKTQHLRALSDLETEKQTLSTLDLDNAILPDTVKIQDPKSGHISTVQTINLVHDMEAFSRDYVRAPNPIQRLDQNGKWAANLETPVQNTLVGRKSRG